jgi:hypothetical protein
LRNGNSKDHLGVLQLWNGLAALAGQMHELSSIGSELATFGGCRHAISVGTICGPQTDQMNGLRVYTNGASAETRGGCPIFYSRREDGPYYRWSFDARLSEWQVGRVLRSAFSPKLLAPATWKTVPERLQRSIVEHYED